MLACLVIGARGQVLGKYPGVQYEALRDDHCFDPTGKAKSTLYCNKDAGDHGREVCDKAGGSPVSTDAPKRAMGAWVFDGKQ